jgi:hypothetical protein
MKGFLQVFYKLSEFSKHLEVLNIKAKVSFKKFLYELEDTVQEYEV